jgi:hypothetical protein
MMQAYLARLDNRSFFLAMGGLLLLVASAMFSYLILPQIKGYRAELNTREMLRDIIENGDELENELSTLASQVETLKHDLHGDMANLPLKQMEAYIIGRLQAMSWRHKVELVGIHPGAGQKVKMFKEILFDIELSGEYFNLVEWLKELGRELGFVVIKEYEIKPLSAKQDGEPRLSLDLTIVSYRTLHR